MASVDPAVDMHKKWNDATGQWESYFDRPRLTAVGGRRYIKICAPVFSLKIVGYVNIIYWEWNVNVR